MICTAKNLTYYKKNPMLQVPGSGLLMVRDKTVMETIYQIGESAKEQLIQADHEAKLTQELGSHDMKVRKTVIASTKHNLESMGY